MVLVLKWILSTDSHTYLANVDSLYRYPYLDMTMQEHQPAGTTRVAVGTSRGHWAGLEGLQRAQGHWPAARVQVRHGSSPEAGSMGGKVHMYERVSSLMEVL
jgi:hypothetical protein